MRKLQWISLTVVAVLVVVLILARNCLREESARYEVMQLLRIAFPPQSVCMSEPYFSGGGNNAKICVSASITCVVGSSLSRPEIQDYYTQRLGSKWKIIDAKNMLDEMLSERPDISQYEINYIPDKYKATVPEDVAAAVKRARELQELRNRLATIRQAQQRP